MPIEVTCNDCFHTYRVRDERAGNLIKCKECGAKIRVPESDDELPEPARRSTSKSKKSGSRRNKSSGNSSVVLFAGIGGAAVVAIAVIMVLVLNRGPKVAAAVAEAQAAPPMTPATPLASPAANPPTAGANPVAAGTPVAAAIPTTPPAANPMPAAATLPADDNTWQVVPDPLPPAFAWPEKVTVNIPIPGEDALLLCPSTHSPFVAFGFKAYESQGAQMWNLATGKQTGEIKGKASMAFKRAISPDGKYLAIHVLQKDVHNKLELWSFESGTMIGSFSDPDAKSITVMDFGPAETLVCYAHTVVNGKPVQRFTLWDITKGTMVRQFEPTGLNPSHHTFSPGRRYFAAFGVDSRVQVYDLTTGKLAGAIKLPRQSSFIPDSLRFSPDGDQLVALMSGSEETRIMVIDIKTGKHDPELDCVFPGHLLSTIDGGASYQGPKLECLPNRTFLIAGSLWVDGDTGRVVWYLDRGPDRYNSAERIAVPNGLIVREGSDEQRQLVVLESPSEAITASLKAIDAGQPGAVRPGQAVSLAIKIGKLLHGTPEETTAALTETLTERLAAVGIEVTDEQPTVLRIEYQEALGNTLQESIRTRNGNGPLLGGVPTGKSVQTTQAALTMSWTRDKVKKPLWSKILVVNPTILFVEGEITPEKARTAMFDDLKNTLLAQPIPYFIPDDQSLVQLPGVSVLKDPEATAGSRNKTRIDAAKKRKKK